MPTPKVKIDGEWTALFAGPRGATGPQGEPGPDGATGVQGASGVPGEQGATGATGEMGPQGWTGPDGATGVQGWTGPDGATGVQGWTGPNGPVGDSAYDVAVANGFVGTESEWLDSLKGEGASSWADITDKPSTFTPEAHTHEPGEVGADPRGMAVAAGAPVGSVVAVSHDFSRTPDGPVHGVLSNGAGTYDPTAWQDGRTVEGESIDVVLEVAHVVDGVLRHRGTRLAAAAVVDLPAGPSHAITLGYVEPTAGPGGGYPTLGMPETEYASTRVSFIDAATSNGYVAYIQQADDTADHEFVIVRDTAKIPDVIAGPWNIGRRLTEKDCWTFRHDGSTYSILVNGQTIGSVFDDTWDPATLDSAGIVFSSGSLWLPGVPWWTLALVGQRTAAWADITEKPADFPPATHSHSLGDLTTADTDTTKVVTPDGSGGFTLAAAPSGGSEGVWGGSGAAFILPWGAERAFWGGTASLSTTTLNSGGTIVETIFDLGGDDFEVVSISMWLDTPSSEAGARYAFSLVSLTTPVTRDLIADVGTIAIDGTTGAKTLTLSTPVPVPRFLAVRIAALGIGIAGTNPKHGTATVSPPVRALPANPISTGNNSPTYVVGGTWAGGSSIDWATQGLGCQNVSTGVPLIVLGVQ